MSRSETKSAFALGVFCALLTLPFASVPALADDWEQYQHDSARTGTSTANFNPQSLELSWNSPAGYYHVITANGMAYATSATTIGAFDLNTGASRWTYTLSDRVSAPAYADGLVAFTTDNLTTDQTALQVVDAQTGRALYSVPSVHDITAPTLYHDPATGYLIAYTNDSAYRVTPTGATKLWGGGQGFYASERVQTVVGNSLVFAQPYQYYAIDRATGVSAKFFSGNGDGASSCTPVYDAARHELYVQQPYDTPGTTLTAWSYQNGHFSFLWEHPGPGIGWGNGVALGPDGSIYSTDGSTLVQLDPTDGHTIKSVGGQAFASGSSPIVSTGYVWDFQSTTAGLTHPQVVVFDRHSLELVTSFGGSPGGTNLPFQAIGTLDESHFILDYANSSTLTGFSVYKALPGDANKNGVTGFDDLLILTQNYGATGATFGMGDLTGDGTVGFDDLLLLAQHYGEQLHSAAVSTAVVPEPATVVVLVLASAVRRRKRN